MGDMADDADNFYPHMYEQGDTEPEDRKTYWYQRDGTPIRYVDMKEGHLRNSIAMMERNRDPEELGVSMTYMMLCNELNRRKKLHEVENQKKAYEELQSKKRMEQLAEQRRKTSPEYRIQQLEEQVEYLKELLGLTLDDLNYGVRASRIQDLNKLGPK